MSDSNYEPSEDEETEIPPDFFECTKKKSSKDEPLLAPEFSFLVGI